MFQVVGMVGEGMQYMQQPQVISVPIALPGAKPGMTSLYI